MYPFLPQIVNETDADDIFNDESNPLSACVKLSKLLSYYMDQEEEIDGSKLPFIITNTVRNIVSLLFCR